MTDRDRMRELVAEVRAQTRATSADADRIRAAVLARVAADGSADAPPRARSAKSTAWVAGASLAIGVAVLVARGGLRPPSSPRVRDVPATSPSSAPPSPAPHVPRVDVSELPVAAVPPAPSAAARVPANEIDVLARAESARRRGAPEAALALVSEHEARFPHGAYVEERDALRVHLLCDLGRDEDARRAMASFEAAHPRSPALPALRLSCVGRSPDPR